jgi:nitrogen fixation/metabolism regulation signal transduction histidine kinase
MSINQKILLGFRTQIIIRVVILLLLCVLLGAVMASTNWFFTPLVIILLILITTANLIHYQEATNRDITVFLTSLKQSNFTNHYFPKRKGKSFDQLEELFHDINDSFLKVNLEKESHYQYLQALNENIGVAIISYLDSGEIQLINPAAKNLIKKPLLSNINHLELIIPDVYLQIKALEIVGGTKVISTMLAGDQYELSITCKHFIAKDVPFHVVLIQDIKKALDDKEAQSWQRLVKVLTHEIMNSVTPIASLSEAVNQSMKASDMQNLDPEDLQDLQVSIETIENRSKGMVKFVNAYKDYARDLELNRQPIAIETMVSHVARLLDPLLNQHAINLSIDIVPISMRANVDAGLIEQVLINLVKNASEALHEVDLATINITAKLRGDHCEIRIVDNGVGIRPENMANIFVPFFTTKRKGSGVGLSLSKKILQLHGGDILAKSSTIGTEFSLTIPIETPNVPT